MVKTPVQPADAPTLRDVADRAGVSRFTVSAVLNGARSNTRVSPATRKRIEDAAQTLGYHPNAMARSLMGQRINTLGVFFGPVEPSEVVSNPYATGLLQGIVAEAASLHNNITLFTEPWRDTQSLAQFRDGRTDGIIAIAPLVGSGLVEELRRIGVAVVSIAGSADAQVPTVDTDNQTGIRLATEHLLGLGHQRILHLTGDGTMIATQERREAFVQTLQDAGIATVRDAAENWVYACRYSGHDVAEALPGLIAAHRPTAIVAGNDNIAVAAIAQAQRMGLNVPRDLSIIGFDDAPSAALITPGLTTMRQPLATIGATAARLLHQTITGEAIESPHQRFAPQLVVRSSTVAPDQRTAIVGS